MGTIEGVLRRKDAEMGFYRQLGAADGNTGIGDIFAMLAEDELRHRSAIQALEEGEPVVLESSPTLDAAKAILRRLSVLDAPLAGFSFDLERLHLAMALEADCARAFALLAAHADEDSQRRLFSRLAEDEEIHFTLIENMHELVSAAAGALPPENEVKDAV
jgi:rubrerythrin